MDIKLPIALPAGWTSEKCSFGILIEAKDGTGRFVGGVIVNEVIRGFAMGVAPVHRARNAGPSAYQGRGWRERLYRDAVEALGTVIR
nr:hypothetical protein [Burkholderia ambifaria]